MAQISESDDDEGYDFPPGFKPFQALVPECWVVCFITMYDEDNLDKAVFKTMMGMCGCETKLSGIARFNPYLTEPHTVQILDADGKWVDTKDNENKTLDTLDLDMIQIKMIFPSDTISEEIE